jgi:glucose-6-phosphate 1-dehydrogenase
MLGDSTLYARADAVEAAWRFVAPIQRVWAEEKASLEFYPAGTFGPALANGLIDDYAEGWHYPCKNLGEDGQYCAL